MYCHLSVPILSFACYLGFDVGDLSENDLNDVEGMDVSAAHVANLLSAEPADGNLSLCERSYFVVFAQTVAINP